MILSSDSIFDGPSAGQRYYGVREMGHRPILLLLQFNFFTFFVFSFRRRWILG